MSRLFHKKRSFYRRSKFSLFARFEGLALQDLTGSALISAFLRHWFPACAGMTRKNQKTIKNRMFCGYNLVMPAQAGIQCLFSAFSAVFCLFLGGGVARTLQGRWSAKREGCELLAAFVGFSDFFVWQESLRFFKWLDLKVSHEGKA